MVDKTKLPIWAYLHTNFKTRKPIPGTANPNDLAGHFGNAL